MGFSELMKRWHRRYVEDEDEKTHFSHSISYHNYFQGYSEKKVLRGEGKGYRIEREYTAPYLAFTESKRTWICFKLLYAALYLTSAALCLLTLISGARANDADWVAVFGVLQMVMALLMLIPAVNYMIAPMYMRMGQYNLSAKRLGLFAKPASALAVLYLVMSLIWYVVQGTPPGSGDLLGLAFQLFSVSAVLALCILEHKMKYKRIANPASDAKGYDGNQIW